MQLYPGQNPVTGAVTIHLTPGYGLWPTPDTVTDGDERDAQHLNAAVQAATDRTNWLGWRAVDWIYGGDYSALYRGSVLLGGRLTIDRSWSSDAATTAYFTSGTGGGYALEAWAGGGNGAAILAAGDGSGAGVKGYGGANGAGGIFTGGITSGAGLQAIAQGGNSAGLVATGHGNAAGVNATGGATGSGAIFTAVAPGAPP